MSIRDLNRLDTDPFAGKIYDVCICGAGPAGITLARKLADTYSVCLLEAGDRHYTPESQDCYKGEISAEPYFPLDQCRLRYLGGASNHWGGACRPLDARDFEKKPYVKYSGWPIGRQDLDPYLREAKEIFEIPVDEPEVPTAEGSEWLPPFRRHEQIEFWLSPQVRFGEKYEGELERHPRIEVFLNANVTDIWLEDDLRTTKYYEVTDYRGRKFRAHARLFILATGGLENPRVLLNANHQLPHGIGNEHDLVGRFFTDHPHQHLGEFLLEDDIRAAARRDPVYMGRILPIKGRFLRPSDGYMREARVLSYSLGIRPTFAMQHVPDTPFKARLRDILCSSELLRESAEFIKNGSVTCFDVDGHLKIQSEQEPNPDSRITLARSTDRFALRRMDMQWRRTDLDRRTIKDAALLAARLFPLSHRGRVRLERWLHEEPLHLPGPYDGTPSIVAGPHHMCTTRMADDPREGVVDRWQRVHSNTNLYIAGSSSFASGGFANPTFTIVQMSLRLADHLKGLKSRLA